MARVWFGSLGRNLSRELAPTAVLYVVCSVQGTLGKFFSFIFSFRNYVVSMQVILVWLGLYREDLVRQTLKLYHYHEQTLLDVVRSLPGNSR